MTCGSFFFFLPCDHGGGAVLVLCFHLLRKSGSRQAEGPAKTHHPSHVPAALSCTFDPFAYAFGATCQRSRHAAIHAASCYAGS